MMPATVILDQPASITIVPAYVHNRGRRVLLFTAQVLDYTGRVFEAREFLGNPQRCDDWAASWGLPIEGSTWIS